MSIDRSDLIAVRASLPSDYNFILATWLRGLKYGNDWFDLIEQEAYYKSYHAFIQSLLTKESTSVKVACLKDDPEVVLGYSVHSGDILHWVFVKKPWRNIGIAKSLIPRDTKVVTHLTVVGRGMLRKHPNVHFNPFAV